MDAGVKEGATLLDLPTPFGSIRQHLQGREKARNGSRLAIMKTQSRRNDGDGQHAARVSPDAPAARGFQDGLASTMPADATWLGLIRRFQDSLNHSSTGVQSHCSHRDASTPYTAVGVARGAASNGMHTSCTVDPGCLGLGEDGAVQPRTRTHAAAQLG